jgi:hypothetical protein
MFTRWKTMLLVVPAAFGLTLSLIGPAFAANAVNHSEFNNIYFAERKSEFENRAEVTEVDRVNLFTNPDSYIIYYNANITDTMSCVYRVETHDIRGTDGNLYIRPWKGFVYCNGNTQRWQMDPMTGRRIAR